MGPAWFAAILLFIVLPIFGGVVLPYLRQPSALSAAEKTALAPLRGHEDVAWALGHVDAHEEVSE